MLGFVPVCKAAAAGFFLAGVSYRVLEGRRWVVQWLQRGKGGVGMCGC